ncbi:MAG TPA: ABC transporter substrate-binding protein [Stellaceae bacterium]|nr:ABC transporter substrate-binding protein [Stellaceae bacterium]
MRRRDFIIALGSVAAVSAPLLARAQQAGKTYRIAIVSPATPVTDMNESGSTPYHAFLSELRRLGYVESENLRIERFSGGGRAERYHELVSEVVRANPDAVLTTSNNLLLEFKTQTTTIPIVGAVSDPVAFGVVSSLARPGGNITGVTVDAGIEIWGKRLDLLRQALPGLARMGYVVTTTPLGNLVAAALKEASSKAGISLVGAPLEGTFDASAYSRAFAAMAEAGAQAVFIGDEPENFSNRRLTVELAHQHRLPAIYPFREAVEIGGLMAYAIDFPDLFSHAADQIDQILKGAKPADLPFYQVRKFALVINLKTAKALGIQIPNSPLAQADEVIE